MKGDNNRSLLNVFYILIKLVLVLSLEYVLTRILEGDLSTDQ